MVNQNKKLSIIRTSKGTDRTKTPIYHDNTQYLNNKPITAANNEYKQEDKNKKDTICSIFMSVDLTNWSKLPIFCPSSFCYCFRSRCLMLVHTN